ncbi:zinc protease [Pseudomonas hunanensis]|uniref:Zinc protease n=1 Tax=Pseudomonas hunanensis TaxID=1247546 RepID=A0ACC6KA77_9PSED|nr:zinc protease [Pseudomonas hunanensis]
MTSSTFAPGIPSGQPPAADASPPLQQFTLANGLTVYLREDHRAPLVSVQLWYHVGSSYEPPGHSGLSHLLEHLMFEGSSKLAPGEYSTLVSRLGGEPNALTTHDATCFPVTLPSSRLEVVLEAMADAMASATLDPAAFARELQVVMAERRSTVDDNPLALAIEAAQRLAHGTSTYATPVIGHQADLEQMTWAQVSTWYQSWYHPNNATLVVVGDLDLERLQPLVERHFGPIPANRLPLSARPTPGSSLVQRRQQLALPGMRDGLIMAFNMPSQATARSLQEACALRLLPQLLGNGNSARLPQRLLHQRQLLQAMSAAYAHQLRGDSLLSLYMFTNPQQGTPEQAMPQVWAEIEQLHHSAPSERELNRAKARLLASLVFARDNIAEQGHALGRAASSGLDPSQLAHEAQAINSVSPEDVQRVALTYLTQDRLSTTYMTAAEARHA